VSVSVSIVSMNATMSVPRVIASAASIVCTAEALISLAAPDDPNDKGPCHFKRLSVFHGSANAAAAIRARPGLDPFRLPVFVSRDRAAATDATINHPDAGGSGGSAVFESRLPEVVFTTLFAAFERPYRGFYPYLLNSTEIPAERIRARNAELRGREQDVELLYRLPDPWKRQLFVALCRRYGLKPFREAGRRSTTIQVRAPKTFHDQTLWPEYRALAAELDAHLRELTERVIREAIDDDLSEAAEAPKALPAANR